jgi:peptidase E
VLARQIIVLGGGGFSMEPDNPLLDRFVLSLARRPRPKVCFVPTASGDAAEYVEGFHHAFAQHDCQPADLRLFERTVSDLESFVLAQDVIYVGGGSTANLLAVWRVHGLDQILRRAWQEGVVLAGISAGMNCWFEQSVTDSFDVNHLSGLDDGLGLLPGSGCPHYDGEPQRRPTYQNLVGSGALSDGWAADDGAAILFADGAEPAVVSSRPNACAYRVCLQTDGVTEERIAGRYLGD